MRKLCLHLEPRSQDTELEAAELTAVIFSAASQATLFVDRVGVLHLLGEGFILGG